MAKLFEVGEHLGLRNLLVHPHHAVQVIRNVILEVVFSLVILEDLEDHLLFVG